jgi:hypothetical protein
MMVRYAILALHKKKDMFTPLSQNLLCCYETFEPQFA